METRIQRWGHSLALRIPRAFAAEMRLEERSEVELSLQDGVLVVKRMAGQELKLEDLLAGVTEENQHREQDYGPRAGKEAW